MDEVFGRFPGRDRYDYDDMCTALVCAKKKKRKKEKETLRYF